MLKKSDFFKHHFLRVFEKNRTGQRGAFSKTIFLRVFEKWDPDIFQKSEISKISSSSHSKNAHIKLNGFQWVFGGWGDAPFIFFMGRMGQKSKNGPSRAVYPPGWGNRYPYRSDDGSCSGQIRGTSDGIYKIKAIFIHKSFEKIDQSYSYLLPHLGWIGPMGPPRKIGKI